MKKIIGVVLFLQALGSSASAASFDCAKAASTVEHIICDSNAVSHLDEELSESYKNRRRALSESDRAQLAIQQRSWLADRNKCGDAVCVEMKYKERIAQLSESPSTSIIVPPSKSETPLENDIFQQEAPDLEARYIKNRDSAYTVLTKRTLISAPASSAAACSMLINDMYITADENDRLTKRCTHEVSERIVALKRELQAQRVAPLNCLQWAIREGDSWQTAKLDMQHSPLAKTTGPIRFSGRISDGNEGELIVFNGTIVANAVVVVSEKTAIYEAENIKVGGFVEGYGRKTSSQSVILASGQQTTIPVIDALCIF